MADKPKDRRPKKTKGFIDSKATRIFGEALLSKISKRLKEAGILDKLLDKGFNLSKAIPGGYGGLRMVVAAIQEMSDDIPHRTLKTFVRASTQELSNVLEYLELNEAGADTRGKKGDKGKKTAAAKVKTGGNGNYIQFLFQLPPDILKPFLDALDEFDADSATVCEQIGKLHWKQLETILKKMSTGGNETKFDLDHWRNFFYAFKKSFDSDTLAANANMGTVHQMILRVEDEDARGKLAGFIGYLTNQGLRAYNGAVAQMVDMSVAELTSLASLESDTKRLAFFGIKERDTSSEVENNRSFVEQLTSVGKKWVDIFNKMVEEASERAKAARKRNDKLHAKRSERIEKKWTLIYGGQNGGESNG